MTQHPGDYVRLTRLIKAPRQKVYDAWLDPDVRRQWWCATDEMTCGVCDLDPTPGGDYRINMCKDGKEWVTVGRFVELDPPRKLVFTWSWEGMDFGKDSRVTVELFETDFDGRPATELVLMHEQLKTPHERSEHTSGWLGCLKSLSKMFADAAEPAAKG